MNKWPAVGGVLILIGIAILLLLAGFIVSIIITLLKLVAVFIGIFLILGGVAMVLFGGKWRKRGQWETGPPPASA